jgi:hypothetical protein
LGVDEALVRLVAVVEVFEFVRASSRVAEGGLAAAGRAAATNDGAEVGA